MILSYAENNNSERDFFEFLILVTQIYLRYNGFAVGIVFIFNVEIHFEFFRNWTSIQHNNFKLSYRSGRHSILTTGLQTASKSVAHSTIELRLLSRIP